MQEDTARGVYPIVGLQARCLRKFAINHALGLGFDLTYNESIGKNEETYYYPNNYKDNISKSQHLTFSTFLLMNIIFIAFLLCLNLEYISIDTKIHIFLRYLRELT